MNGILIMVVGMGLIAIVAAIVIIALVVSKERNNTVPSNTAPTNLGPGGTKSLYGPGGTQQIPFGPVNPLGPGGKQFVIPVAPGKI